MKKIPIICCVDTGIDDAVALAFALYEENLDLKLVTTCAGNTTLENCTLNTLNILQWFGCKDLKVCEGASAPLKGERIKLDCHGGPTGMGYYPFSPCTLTKSSENAVEAMAKVLEKSKQKVYIICTAPATDVAKLLLAKPELKNKIEKIVFQTGLITDKFYSSFNLACDPYACEILLQSGVPLLICPSDMGHLACLNDAEVGMMKVANKTGDMFSQLFNYFKDRVCKERIAMHDSCAVACISKPELFTIEQAKITINYFDGGVGLIFDFADKTPNCMVCSQIKIARFKKYMFSVLKKIKVEGE